MTDAEIKERVIILINKIRPFILNDGGNLEFVNFENGIVYIRMMGACKDCDMLDITLKNGIEEIIINDIPDVKEVRNID